jgi:hypothetical protein
MLEPRKNGSCEQQMAKFTPDEAQNPNKTKYLAIFSSRVEEKFRHLFSLQ